ncbi:MAG: DegT/DnrJ/EryC1/StrS family aminotransferase [Deltaproteobacteria bacterium]|nr:DegT/DnrJ/EryC1/StrS family aminotransferase [Deltaproteobacteria bacterium]
MKVPLLDLRRQYLLIKDEVMSAAEEVFDSQQYIFGPKLEELEERIAVYSGCKYAVGVSSGTDALLVSLMAAGLGDRDEVGRFQDDLVITTPYTFFATAGSIVRLGAKPLFVDIDEKTYNIDPCKLNSKIRSMGKGQRSKLRAIIPVHLYGQCADMEPIENTIKDLNLSVDYPGMTLIEDAAQAIGAEYEYSNGVVKRSGSMGQSGCFSFYPTKNLGGFGEGGMVTTNDRRIYERIIAIRHHGDTGRYNHKYVGGNFRLDAIQAALILVKFKYLEDWNNRRIENAKYYRKLFKEREMDGICLPYQKEIRHIYNQFVIRVPRGRDKMMKYLLDNGVGCAVYYPIPLHLQECFQNIGLSYKTGDFPVSEKAALETLALPIYPELEKEQLAFVVDTVKKYFDQEKV